MSSAATMSLVFRSSKDWPSNITVANATVPSGLTPAWPKCARAACASGESGGCSSAGSPPPPWAGGCGGQPVPSGSPKGVITHVTPGDAATSFRVCVIAALGSSSVAAPDAGRHTT